MYMFLNFSTQWNSIRWRNRRWKVKHLNPALESLFTFTLLVFRTKKGAWHKRIQLMKGSDFPSPRTTNSVRLILSSQYSIGNPRLSHVQFCKNYIKRVHLLWWLNKFLVPMWSPWEPILTHRWQLSLTEGESDFPPLPVFFFGVSSAIAHIIWVLVIRVSCFYISHKNFQPVVFSFVWAKYKWKFMRDRCKLSFPRPLAPPLLLTTLTA